MLELCINCTKNKAMRCTILAISHDLFCQRWSHRTRSIFLYDLNHLNNDTILNESHNVTIVCRMQFVLISSMSRHVIIPVLRTDRTTTQMCCYVAGSCPDLRHFSRLWVITIPLIINLVCLKNSRSL